MTATVVTLFKKATALDEGDRAALAGLLLESLDPPADTGVEAAWAQEIETRIRDLDSGKVKTVPWERVKTKLAARLGNARKR